jgi:hypothetical protein
MNHRRLLVCSVAGAGIITALAHLSGGAVGAFLTAPGMMIAMSFEVVVMMLSETEYYYPMFRHAPLFNVIFYSASIHVVLWLYAIVKRDDEGHRESLRQYTLRHPNG